MKPYIILSMPEVNYCAGSRALHILNKALNKNGAESHIVYPSIKYTDIAELINERQAIAIYNEATWGNPLGASKVVRYVMNYPGNLGGWEVFDDEEIVISYSATFDSHIQNVLSGHLYIPTIERDLFYNQNLERIYETLTYKGKARIKVGSKVLTRTDPPTRQGVAHLLNQTGTFYCSDNLSIMYYEAALCGCHSVLLPDMAVDMADLLKDPLGLCGVVYGTEPRARAEATKGELIARYARECENFDNNVKNFIDLTQDQYIGIY